MNLNWEKPTTNLQGGMFLLLPLGGICETKSMRKSQRLILQEEVKQGRRQEDNPAVKQKSWLHEVNSHTVMPQSHQNTRRVPAVELLRDYVEK